MKLLSGILTGLTGGLQLYSGVKRLFGGRDRRADRIMANARAAEQAWYKRNYYNDYFNSSMARAAMKRVEDTLKNSRQNRAYAAVTGATPETTLAQNEQGLNTAESMMTNLAAQESGRRSSVDAQHLQNQSSLYNQELKNLEYDDTGGDPDLIGGLSLIHKAIEGVNWGNEFKKLKKDKE